MKEEEEEKKKLLEQVELKKKETVEEQIVIKTVAQLHMETPEKGWRKKQEKETAQQIAQKPTEGAEMPKGVPASAAPLEQEAPTKAVEAKTQTAAPPPTLDVDKLVERINRAIVRGGGGGGFFRMFMRKEKSDTAQILEILLSVNYNSRQLIAQVFKRRFEHEDLVELIRKEVQEEAAKDLIIALLDNPGTLDAMRLHKAIAGIGTTESVLIDILVTRNNAQMEAIKQEYNRIYGKHLEAHIAGDTSGSFRTVLQSLCAANRDESATVKPAKAEQDARVLFSAGEKKLGTDDDVFIALLTRDNFFQLRALSDAYNQLTGHHLDEAVRKEFTGDVRDALETIIQFARNPSRLFAERINAAIKANKESEAIRLLTAHPTPTYNLAAITSEFHTKYGTSLEQALSESKFTNGIKNALVTIASRGGVL